MIRGSFLPLITKQILNAKAVLTKIICVHTIPCMGQWNRNMMQLLKILNSSYVILEVKTIKNPCYFLIFHTHIYRLFSVILLVLFNNLQDY